MIFRRFTILNAFFIFVFYFTLVLSLAYFFDGAHLLSLLLSERAVFTIQLSLLAASVSSILAMIIAIPAAYALSRFQFPGRFIIDSILEFPLIISPAALGAMVLIFFNNPIGQWIQDHIVFFVFTFFGIILAQFITILGLAVRFVKTAFDEVPVELEKVAASLGASPFISFFMITLPLAKRGLFAAFVLSWAKAIGEFGATITIAGSMAMKTETLPIAIFTRLASADIEGTVAFILLLLFFGLAPLILVRWFSQGRLYVRNS